MTYDKADWHSGGDFPKDLPPENGGTHIGMFLAWMIMSGLEGEELREDSLESLKAVQSRTMTGREFLFKECDGKFWDSDLSEEGNAFAKYYYSYPDSKYIQDYVRVFQCDAAEIYCVEDSWSNFDKMAAVISERFAEWKTKIT